MNQTATKASIPDHVDPALVYDYDLLGGMGEPVAPHVALLKAKREAPRVFFTPRNGGHWIATHYADVAAISADWESFTTEKLTFPHREQSEEELTDESIWLIPQGVDPPMHTTFRKLLNPFFSPAAVKKMKDDMREHVVRLIAKVKAEGTLEYDFVARFGMPVPVLSFMDLLGLPRDRYAEFVGWTDAYYRAVGPEEQDAAIGTVNRFLDGLIDDRLAHPGDDLMSKAINLTIDDEPLPRSIIHALAFNLFLAGLDSVTASLSFIVEDLANKPERQAELRADPKLIAGMIEEYFLNRTIANVPRRVTRDMEFAGAMLKRNDTIVMANTVAALNEPLGDKKQQHIAFGYGPHFCIGMFMAKMEMQIFFEEWFAGLPQFEIQPDKSAHYRSGVVFSVTDLPIRHRAED